MEVMTSPNYPWDDLHHKSYYLPQLTNSSLSSNQYTMETRDFIPSDHIDWFQNPILGPNAFKEGNMANISPTIQIDISLTLGIMENISVEETCTPIEVQDLKHLFQEF